MRLNDIIDAVSKYAPDANVDVIMRAYVYAAKAHAGQTRRSGEPYLTHPMAVAGILTDLRMDVDTIATALLHDTMEDTLATRPEMIEMFGEEIADLVDGVTKIGKLQFKSREVAQAENFRKMIVAMSKDVRVILVKLADRLHNMRTMEHMKAERQRAISQETLDIYAPIANRLGLHQMKRELEDHCFEYLHPDVYAELKAKLEAGAADREAYIATTSKELELQLTRLGLPVHAVKGRAKHIYSIYSKMQERNLEFEQIHDLLAFRVLVEDLGQCYTALGFVHSLFHPLPDRIKDYIATPKSNGYQSLHTVVLGPAHRQVEIQIRTREMHRVAEVGIAAHWRYKEGHLALSKEDIGKIYRLRELFEAAQEVDDPQEFLETIKVDLFQNEIFAFSPKGDVYAFPLGATALDFAYAIHTEVGNHCVGAKVNDRMVPLKHELRNGDRIEILTQPTQHPSRDWLEFAKTGRALSKIRRVIREDERERGRVLGKEILENELKKRDQNLQKLSKSGELKEAAKRLNFKSPDHLFLALTTGNVTVAKVLKELIPQIVEEEQRAAENSVGMISQFMQRFRRAPRAHSPVLISGEEDLLVAYAQCCNPIPGEPVVGFVTRGRGITVHLATCPQLLAMEEERRIDVEWHPKHKGKHSIEIRVVCVDKPGMLADIAASCKALDVNISRMETQSIDDNKAVLQLEVAVEGVEQLEKLVRAFEKIRGVISVERIRTETGPSGGIRAVT
jgi:guanosine-3',5'-bis(diphosphate) 3'-pyrophosphohydrolase